MIKLTEFPNSNLVVRIRNNIFLLDPSELQIPNSRPGWPLSPMTTSKEVNQLMFLNSSTNFLLNFVVLCGNPFGSILLKAFTHCKTVFRINFHLRVLSRHHLHVYMKKVFVKNKYLSQVRYNNLGVNPILFPGAYQCLFLARVTVLN